MNYIEHLTFSVPVLLLIAGFLGGAINAVAGGGTFLVFPLLIFTGLSPVSANATATFALWPGSISAALAYRGLHVENMANVRGLMAASLTGSLIGAVILLATPEATFRGLVGPLLLLATVLFAFGPRALRRANLTGEPSPKRHHLALMLQFFVGIYGGYFGAGMGILMLAMLQLYGMSDIHRMNALKTILGALINVVAVVIFMIAGIIGWPHALPLLIGAVSGGYIGARVAQKVPVASVRAVVIFVGVAMSGYFLLQ